MNTNEDSKYIYTPDSWRRNSYVVGLTVLFIIISFIPGRHGTPAAPMIFWFLETALLLAVLPSSIDRVELTEGTVTIMRKRLFRHKTIVMIIEESNIEYVKKIGARGSVAKTLRLKNKEFHLDIEPGISGWGKETLDDLNEQFHQLKKESAEYSDHSHTV